MVMCSHNPNTWETEVARNHELEANLDYRESLRQAVLHNETVPQGKEPKQNKTESFSSLPKHTPRWILSS